MVHRPRVASAWGLCIDRATRSFQHKQHSRSCSSDLWQWDRLASTANGLQALFSNTTGNANIANGDFTLFNDTSGANNTANGFATLFSNTGGSNNTADGLRALFNNTTGSNNIALGYLAGSNLTTGNNNIDIGNSGIAAEANTIRIGTVGRQNATFIAGISGTAVAGSSVVVNGNGQLGTTGSS